MGFEPRIPASERAETVHALDRAATVNGLRLIKVYLLCTYTQETELKCFVAVIISLRTGLSHRAYDFNCHSGKLADIRNPGDVCRTVSTSREPVPIGPGEGSEPLRSAAVARLPW
jgi:hypothetical protein